ncbi:Mss4-like protein [Mycena alexandri]|uniref:Mss4-like protein n=1 Tax=Mycena alexandri TaxID=1745969 RepID=A0AAD6SV82_9AGAR|nr:Mss4-like protein [Mycena alexandri]
MAQLAQYHGNCHCGAFKFTLKTPELKEVYACNCSSCSKKGYLWTLPAKIEDFAVVNGDETATLSIYECGKRTSAHKFCPTCGTAVMVRMHSAENPIGINLRALSDLDLDSLPVLMNEAANLEPLYQVPEPLATGVVPEGMTVYHGSCHCGAIRYTLLSPHKIATATECNCSICSRNASLWIYPLTTTARFEGVDNLTEYTFASNLVYHGFCKICGVPIRARFVGDSDTGLDLRTMRMNLRTMNGLDLSGLEIKKVDGRATLPAYEV